MYFRKEGLYWIDFKVKKNVFNDGNQDLLTRKLLLISIAVELRQIDRSVAIFYTLHEPAFPSSIITRHEESVAHLTRCTIPCVEYCDAPNSPESGAYPSLCRPGQNHRHGAAYADGR